MKKFLTLVLSIVMICTMSSFVFASEDDIMLISANPNADEKSVEVITEVANEIRVQNDGKYIDFDDVAPQIINGRTMVPFRKIFNSLGVTEENITWVPETRTVIAKKDNVEIELQIDNNIAKKTVSGETKEITLDSAPVIVDGRTLVPVRFIAESMEKQVDWDAENKTVIIIDVNKINDELRNAIPKYFDIVELQTTPLSTFEGKATVKGSLKYTDKDDSSNNSTVDIKGTFDIQKSEDAVRVDMDLTLSGKGAIYEAIKKAELTKLDFAVILTDEKVYIKSSLFGTEYANKWIASESDSTKGLIQKLNASYANPSNTKALTVVEEDLTVNSYAKSILSCEIIKFMFNDKNITISGKNPVKYTVKIDILEVIEFLNDYGLGLDLDVLKTAKMNLSGSVKDGVATSGGIDFELTMKEDNESLSLKLDVDTTISKYNKNVNIKIPSENELVSE